MALKSSNKVETNVYELEITVDAETFTEACKKAYLKQRKSIQIPGFRKGKATQGMIEKVYGEGAFYEEALEIVYPEAVGAAFEEAGLNVVDQPSDVDFPVMSKAEGVVITMKVTTYPEVKLGEYKGIKGKMLDTDATDEDVETELKNMQERNSRLVTVEDREAAMGDTCDINFEGFVDDVAFDGGKGENYPLELGSNSFIPGFEEQVAGHKAGEEFDVNVTFPEQYEPSLAGKDAVFKCKINEIKAKELPELDDEFAKDVSEFDTLDELKEDLKKQIADRKAENAKIDFENQILEQVCENMEVEIPECMFTQKCDEMVQDYAYRLQMQGLDLNTYLQYLGQTMDQFKEQFMEGAKQQVKSKLALDAIVKAENIEASEEEIEAEINKLAEQYNMEADKIKTAVPTEQLSADITTRKAVDFIVDNAVKE
ncbi:trigger factor [uncultured Eubacterium sp.]|uniref:trigger factor n=1 Tax=uncultured Eubacterium sp. TaxID=165185 RepID=UPI002606AD0F|nr:trigger factor [uncultured Eubacterium sp.]